MATRPAQPTRRDRLIAVAIDMFTRHGVRRTSIEGIAVQARIAKGSVYLEFRTKEELFRAAAEQVIGEILAAASAASARDGALEDQITEILSAKFWRLYELVHSRPHARELIDAKDSTAADVYRLADDRYAAILARALTGASERGQWRAREPYTTADVVAVLLRAAHGTGFGAAKLGAAAYRRRLRLAVGMILAGAGRS